MAANFAIGAMLVLLARFWPTRWDRARLILLFGPLFSIRRVIEHYYPGHGDAIDAVFLAALAAFGVSSGVTSFFFAWYDRIRDDQPQRTSI